jgi:thiamine-phosphate diphosphorylase
VRTLCPRPFLVGRSIHALDDVVAEHADVDYFVFGTVFESRSKPGREAAGLTALAAAVAATSVPVLAIGGIEPGNVGLVLRAGAAGVAGIGAFASDPTGAVARMGRRPPHG